MDQTSFHMPLLAIFLLFILGNNSNLLCQDAQSPNVIVVVVDDLGWKDLGYHGSAILSPNIDSLAANGTLLDRFYASNLSSASRAGILTGQHPGRFGLSEENISPKKYGGLNPNAITLAEMLKKEGYEHRACIGKWQLGHSNVKYHPLNHGFTHFYGNYGDKVDHYSHQRDKFVDWHRNYELADDEGYSTSLLADEAVSFIASVPNEPFFLYLSFNAPQSPLQAPQEYLDLYDFDESQAAFSAKEKKKTTDQASRVGQGNSKRQTYSAMVSAIDDAIGQVVSALELLEIRENTLIVFVSDGGGNPKEGAASFLQTGNIGEFYEGNLRTPAFVNFPSKVKAGQKTDAICATIDIAPTVLSLINAEHEYAFDGIDLSPILSDKKNSESLQNRILYLGPDALVSEKFKFYKGKLFFLPKDKKEKRNLSKRNKKTAEKFRQLLETKNKEFESPGVIKKGFHLSRDWKMPID